MGRLDINTDVALEADDNILDGLEDIVSPLMVEIDMDARFGDVHPDILLKNQSYKNTRRQLEDRLEDMKLLRQITDYSFNLH